MIQKKSAIDQLRELYATTKVEGPVQLVSQKEIDQMLSETWLKLHDKICWPDREFWEDYQWHGMGD